MSDDRLNQLRAGYAADAYTGHRTTGPGTATGTRRVRRTGGRGVQTL
jgi:hypothetical protein